MSDSTMSDGSNPSSPARDLRGSRHKDTLVGHAARDPVRFSGMVNPPVFRGSTVLFEDTATYEGRDPDDYKVMRYGVHGTPTTFAFEAAVAELEGGHAAVAVPSGLAAITAALSAYAKKGSHLLVTDSAYGPARNFCDKRLASWGVDVEYYDPAIGSGIGALIRPDTCAVYCEAPGSMTFEMQDIPAIAAAAHAKGLPVLADNTWGTPYFFRAFDHGVDVSIHAGTKYISGHSDTLIGAIVTNKANWLPVRRSVADFGMCVSPDDCWLALRGLRTIGVRMRHQMQSAITVARFLEAHPRVSRVLFPALESDPGHALWKRDFDGAASLFGVVLKPATDESVVAMIDSLQLFGIGSSWGGYESLAIRAKMITRTATPWNPEGPMVRIHVGLENPQDLIDDLARGLELLSMQ